MHEINAQPDKPESTFPLSRNSMFFLRTWACPSHGGTRHFRSVAAFTLLPPLSIHLCSELNPMTDVPIRGKLDGHREGPRTTEARLERRAYEPGNGRYPPERSWTGAQNGSSLRTSRRNPPCRPPDFIHMASRAVGEETVLGRPVCDSSPGKLTQPLRSI